MTQAQSTPEYLPPHGLLTGQRVVVTAAAGAGIGLATAKRCLEEGAQHVTIGDIHEGRLESTATELAVEFGAERVSAVVCDVRNDEHIDALLQAGSHVGPLDVMVNNAGLGGSVSILDMTDEQWSAVIEITLTGTFKCLRAAGRMMVDQGVPGRIVNNASVIGWRAQAGQAHYAAAKAGVMALTRSAAMDFAPSGIRVNAVSPSLAMHPFLEKVTTPEHLEELKAREAFGRAAEPWEIANAIVFLASGYSSYMTGEVLSISSQHP